MNTITWCFASLEQLSSRCALSRQHTWLSGPSNLRSPSTLPPGQVPAPPFTLCKRLQHLGGKGRGNGCCCPNSSSSCLGASLCVSELNDPFLPPVRTEKRRTLLYSVNFGMVLYLRYFISVFKALIQLNTATHKTHFFLSSEFVIPPLYDFYLNSYKANLWFLIFTFCNRKWGMIWWCDRNGGMTVW